MSLPGAFGLCLWLVPLAGAFEDYIRGFAELHCADCIICVKSHCVDCLIRLHYANYLVGLRCADCTVRFYCAE